MNRVMRTTLLVGLTALLLATSAGARSFVVLMYCSPWGGCSYQLFYYEDVQVVAEYGRLDVLSTGQWGHRWDGCPECEIENPFPPPAPEPVFEGGGGCGTLELDVLRTEYVSRGLAAPGCTEFSSGGSSEYFTWDQLNHSEDNDHRPWGIVSGSVWWNLDTLRAITYANDITVTCGYRCPVQNAALIPQGASPTSHHQYGRAVDLFPAVRDDPGEFALLRYAASVSSPVELLNWDTYSDHHLHVAWW